MILMSNIPTVNSTTLEGLVSYNHWEYYKIDGHWLGGAKEKLTTYSFSIDTMGCWHYHIGIFIPLKMITKWCLKPKTQISSFYFKTMVWAVHRKLGSILAVISVTRFDGNSSLWRNFKNLSRIFRRVIWYLKKLD